MASEEPERKRLCLEPQELVPPVFSSQQNLQNICDQIEQCYPNKCLCDLKESDLKYYVTENLNQLSKCDTLLPEQSSSVLLYLSFTSWLCQTFHDQLSSGYFNKFIRGFNWSGSARVKAARL